MALEVQNGLAVVHGIRNSGSAVTITGYGSFVLDSSKLNHKFGLDELKNEIGFDVSLTATNAHIETEMTWTPTGATRATAEAGAVFLTPLAKVTLANFALATLNGDWVYIGDASIDLSTKMGKMSLKLRKYDDDDQNASLTTTVTG